VSLSVSLSVCLSVCVQVGALSSLPSGEVNPHDGTLTFLGRVLGCLPVDIRLGKLMLLGHVFGVLEETVIISEYSVTACHLSALTFYIG